MPPWAGGAQAGRERPGPGKGGSRGSQGGEQLGFGRNPLRARPRACAAPSLALSGPLQDLLDDLFTSLVLGACWHCGS